MFTGIVEELGVVTDLATAGDSAVLKVHAKVVDADVTHGASISVNGVCLTVIDRRPSPDGTEISFDVMGETLLRSVIADLRPGHPVNLERAARLDGRLDGHIVSGHVDGTASILSRVPGDGWETVRFSLPADLARYVVHKGSITVDGVSLTVSALADDWFEVGLIPETLRATTLGSKPIGGHVNIEVDVLAKYTERLLAAHLGRSTP
jgi:riboflavin synthase